VGLKVYLTMLGNKQDLREEHSHSLVRKLVDDGTIKAS
jgi:hypothetical protein